MLSIDAFECKNKTGFKNFFVEIFSQKVENSQNLRPVKM